MAGRLQIAKSPQRNVHACTRRLALALVSGAIALTAVPASDAEARGPGYASANCAGADSLPHDIPLSQARKATICLINAERRSRGLRGLRSNSRLARAARRHAADMVRNDYFSHDAPSGLDFVDRIVRADYVDPRSSRWLLGENLAWGSGALSTPRAIVRSWMGSPPHRANIVRRGFREIGVAVVPGAPVEGAERAATYASEFGRR